jgi:hypothetical protein
VRTVLGGEVVALEGKSVRRALNRGEDFRVIVSAWATESGLLLGQRKVRDKSNEITVVPELLPALELAGCIVTADASLQHTSASPNRFDANDFCMIRSRLAPWLSPPLATVVPPEWKSRQ